MIKKILSFLALAIVLVTCLAACDGPFNHVHQFCDWAVVKEATKNEGNHVKIKIAYTPDEKKDAAASVAALLKALPSARIRRGDQHPPFRHFYITTDRPPKDPGEK